MLIKVKKFKTILEGIKNKNTKFVLLDLDNTLYSYLPCHQYALKKCYEEFFKLFPITYKNFLEIYKNCGKDVKKQIKNQAASHSRLLYFQRMFEVFYNKTDIKNSLKFEKIYWQKFFEKMKIKGETVSFLKELKKNKIKIVLVTDLTTKLQFEKILYLKLDQSIDFIVTSEEAGREKPHKKIFSLALKKIGANKKDCIIIGDDLEKDGKGGQNLGIFTYIITI